MLTCLPLATALCTLAAVPANAATFTQFDSKSAQSITTSSPTETNRPNRDGTASTCAVPKMAFPGTQAGTFHYSAYTHSNQMNNSACVQVTLNTACVGTNFIFATTYDPSFNPASIATNYLADMGASPNGTPVSYSFTVPAGHTFVDIVNEVTANAGCSSYAISWSSDVPWNSVRPGISGTPVVGHQIQASSGTWTGASGFAYQWRRCAPGGSSCVDILGATASSYTPTASDLGHVLVVRVTAASATTTPSSADSAPSAQVAAVAPSLSGLAVSPGKASITGRKVKGRCVKQTKHNRTKKRCRRPISVTITYTLDQAATVTFAVTAGGPGRKVKGHCVKPTKKNHKRPHCKLKSTIGQVGSSGVAGANTFVIHGTFGGKSMKPGNYQVTITPTANGLTGTPQTVTFKLT